MPSQAEKPSFTQAEGTRSSGDSEMSLTKSQRFFVAVRFGAVNDRKADHRQLVKDSFADSRWRIVTLRNAGSASTGKRQADQFVSSDDAIEEYDVWATLAV